MYVCGCAGVTDRTVEAAIAAGAQDIPEVAARCGAGACCGGCWPELERLLAEHTDNDARRLNPRNRVSAA